MSLDNTSQPSVKYCADKMNATYIHGRPEPELVPSRYALKVGEIDGGERWGPIAARRDVGPQR